MIEEIEEIMDDEEATIPFDLLDDIDIITFIIKKHKITKAYLAYSEDDHKVGLWRDGEGARRKDSLLNPDDLKEKNAFILHRGIRYYASELETDFYYVYLITQ